MSKSLNICLSCGLCCDGTMIGFVKLYAEELSTIKELLDIEIVGEEGFFFHPCKELGCKGCKIYLERPIECRKFECKLLKSLNNKELDFDFAINEVNKIRQKKIAIEKQFATLQIDFKSQSLYFKILELIKMIREEGHELSLLQNPQELISDIKELDMLVSNCFGISYY